MYVLVSSNMGKVKLPRTKQLVVDSFSGLESFYIDELNCYKVESDLTTNTAKAWLTIKAHAGTLTGNLRVSPLKNGHYYRVVIHIYGFWVHSTPTIDIDFITQAVTAAKVGWINMGYSSADGTCYSKSNPSEKDGLCTAILLKKLKEMKGKVLHQIESKASHDVQVMANKFLPFKLPKKPPPPTTPPTTTFIETTTTSGLEVVTTTTTMPPMSTTATTALPATSIVATTAPPATSTTAPPATSTSQES
jgi:hypothetical protein